MRHLPGKRHWKSSKTTTSKKAASDTSKQSGNVISITSYVPTVWDDEEKANEKLIKSLGAEIVGNSMTGKLISGLESAAKVDTNNTPTDTASSESTTLSDVISAIKSLEKSDENRKISLDIDLYARDLMIGKIAVADINDMTRMNGKSPLIN